MVTGHTFRFRHCGEIYLLHLAGTGFLLSVGCGETYLLNTANFIYNPQQVSRFEEVHFQQDRDLALSVIRVERTSAQGTKRDPRVSWFLTLDTLIPLEQVPQRYGLRFSEEHLFRFLKQDLLWLRAHVRTSEQFVRWSWIVALAFTQLYLARPLGLQALLPWEAKGRPVTPRQVRRVMPTILSQLGTPIRACQPRGKASGRAKGFHPQPAPRHPVVRKPSKKQKKAKKASGT